MEENTSEFGQFLKSLRQKKGLTLIDLGEMVGLSNPYLSQIENGKRGIPTPNLLEKLAQALDVPFVVLLDKAWQIKNNAPLIADKNLYNYDLSNMLHYDQINFKGHVLTPKEREGIEGILNVLFPGNDNKSWFEEKSQTKTT